MSMGFIKTVLVQYYNIFLCFGYIVQFLYFCLGIITMNFMILLVIMSHFCVYLQGLVVQMYEAVWACVRGFQGLNDRNINGREKGLYRLIWRLCVEIGKSKGQKNGKMCVYMMDGSRNCFRDGRNLLCVILCEQQIIVTNVLINYYKSIT